LLVIPPLEFQCLEKISKGVQSSVYGQGGGFKGDIGVFEGED
jgi:hypothetical protein